MRIILIEDDRSISEVIRELLQQENYEIDVCYDGTSGLDEILSGIYDCVILDLMLPGKSGIEIIREIRAANIYIPILMLTARSALDDKVNSLYQGADDYLTKPFEPMELLARIHALLRRIEPATADSNELNYGDLILERSKAMLRCISSGEEVKLGEKEFRILEFFMRNPGQILSKEQLAVRIWGYDNESEYNKEEVYLTFLRRKLQYVESRMEIKAVRGLGYILRERNDQVRDDGK